MRFTGKDLVVACICLQKRKKHKHMITCQNPDQGCATSLPFANLEEKKQSISWPYGDDIDSNLVAGVQVGIYIPLFYN